jgi:ketosteroid isomerase-like protein
MRLSERESMNTSRERWEEPVASGEPDGAAALYERDASVLAPGARPVQGRAAIEAAIQGMIDAGFRSAQTQPVERKGGGELVVECGRYAAELRGEGTDAGKYIVVQERQADGSLQLALDMYGSNRPRGAS